MSEIDSIFKIVLAHLGLVNVDYPNVLLNTVLRDLYLFQIYSIYKYGNHKIFIII